jgi:hypothetical protein
MDAMGRFSSWRATEGSVQVFQRLASLGLPPIIASAWRSARLLTPTRVARESTRTAAVRRKISVKNEGENSCSAEDKLLVCWPELPPF